jgi:hypothetical protein
MASSVCTLYPANGIIHRPPFLSFHQCSFWRRSLSAQIRRVQVARNGAELNSSAKQGWKRWALLCDKVVPVHKGHKIMLHSKYSISIDPDIKKRTPQPARPSTSFDIRDRFFIHWDSACGTVHSATRSWKALPPQRRNMFTYQSILMSSSTLITAALINSRASSHTQNC